MSTVIHNHDALDFDRPGKWTYEVAFHHDGTWGNVLVPLTVINGLRGPGKSVACFGGTHGNEYEGQVAVRRLAHDLKPVVQVGKNGLSESLYESLERELDAHELIKVKFMDFRDQKRGLTEELVERTNSALILLIGNIAIVYRQQADPERRKIQLPAS